MNKSDCTFCKIVRNKINAYMIYEDKGFLAFLDISQFTEGHTVVIPKKHVEFIWDDKDFGSYFKVVQKIANHFRSLGYKYVDCLVFGRKIPRAHVHLIPHNGKLSDYRKAIQSIGKLQDDKSRRIKPNDAEGVVKKFKL